MDYLFSFLHSKVAFAILRVRKALCIAEEVFMKNAVKSVAAIHDLSGYGRCSLSVISPILSVMGIQSVAVPTAVLSTHTGGFG